MPVNSTSWAERIAKANESKGSFEPTPLGRANFIIKELPQVTQSQSGNEYIRYRAAIMDGPRANALVFANTHPYAGNPVFFLRLMNAMGITEDWFLSANPPTTEQIAQAMVNRTFSAEVYIEDGAKNDKNGHPYRSLKDFLPVVASEGTAQTAQPAQQQFGQTPAPAQQAPAQQAPAAPAAPAQQGGSPWGAAAGPAPANVPAPDGSPWGTNAPPAPF